MVARTERISDSDEGFRKTTSLNCNTTDRLTVQNYKENKGDRIFDTLSKPYALGKSYVLVSGLLCSDFRIGLWTGIATTTLNLMSIAL